MRFKKLIFVVSFITAFSNCAIAKSNQPEETYEAKKVWLAIPLGGFIGFGLGHATQSRYSDYGWIFTGVDAAALILGISVLGDCKPQDTSCENNRDQRANTATAIWQLSRLMQVTDLSIWSYKYYNKFHSAAYLAPKKDGASVVATISF